MRPIIDSCDSVTHPGTRHRWRSAASRPLAGLTAPAAPRGIRRDRDAGDAGSLNNLVHLVGGGGRVVLRDPCKDTIQIIFRYFADDDFHKP
jgi:hypothetical protein